MTREEYEDKHRQNFREDMTHEELKKVAQPLHQMLCKYGDPHTTIMITQDFVKVMQDETGVPLPVPD